MNIRTVLFVRAAILIIIGVGVLVSSLYNGSNEPETNQEKTVMKIILLATSMVITGIAISNIVFAFFPIVAAHNGFQWTPQLFHDTCAIVVVNIVDETEFVFIVIL